MERKKERDEEEQEIVLSKKEIEKREEKQMKWFFVIVAIVFLSVIIPFTIIQLSKTFDYANVKWYIEKDGKGPTSVKWYATVFDKYTAKGTYYGNHTVYLRNDPRKNDVSFNISDLGFRKKIIFSFDPEILDYSNQALGTMELGKIMTIFPFIEEKIVSTNNVTYARENDLKWNTCSNKFPDSTFIEIKVGTENRIYETGADCYILEMKSTDDYLLVAERFVIEIIKEFNKGKNE